MSLLKTYRGLSSKAKLGVGTAMVAWGVVGLYLSDRAEEKYGYTPSEKDKAALEDMVPKIRFIDSQERSRGGNMSK